MIETLKKASIFCGLFALAVSIFWSQDGFNFDIAGDSGYETGALIVGYGLAIVVSVVQFVFSTNLNELNPSLIVFGVLAYAYSIYTNYLGITHFQGSNTNGFGAWVFAVFVDGTPELLIAWGMGESLTGDFLGNFWKALSGSRQPVKSKPYTPRKKSKYPKYPTPYKKQPTRPIPADQDEILSQFPKLRKR